MDEKTVEEIIKELNIEGIRIDDKKESMILDSDINIFFEYNNKILGTAGISRGLDRYYRLIEDIDETYEQFLAKEKSRYKWGITQIQATPKTTKERSKINYKRELINAWKQITAKANTNLDFYISAELILWNQKSMEDDMFQLMLAKPSEKMLKINYDYFASRVGFKYDYESKLFLRK